MIPKIIHFCWFGNKPKSDLINNCIISWKKFAPDYEIIEWSDTNINIEDLPPLVKVFYSLEKWAYVSDYIRLKKLYDYGGVYLDTDMLLIKKIDDFLENDFFIGAESDELINCAIIGVVPENKIIKKALDFYSEYSFTNNQFVADKIKSMTMTIPIIITNVIKAEYPLLTNWKTLFKDKDITIYPPEYFYPVSTDLAYDVLNYIKYITENSHSVHLWDGSWLEKSEIYYLNKGQHLNAFIFIIKSMISKGHFDTDRVRYFLTFFKRIIKVKLGLKI
jgi:mannosyltransferase OCH1-like enzyme